MLPARIGLASQSSSVDFAALVQVASALALQVSRDLAPVWNVILVLHVSPDAGWEQLSTFLAGIRRELVAGMYDFTSAHILKAVEDARVDGDRMMTLILDHPAPNPSRDQTDEETQKALTDELGDRFKSAWALTNSDAKAPAWIYPNAYHIKVAVREDDTFWLSSGNRNNSNQPQMDMSDVAAARRINAEAAAYFKAIFLHDWDHLASTVAAA
jgi:hypothetical protein